MVDVSVCQNSHGVTVFVVEVTAVSQPHGSRFEMRMLGHGTMCTPLELCQLRCCSLRRVVMDAYDFHHRHQKPPPAPQCGLQDIQQRHDVTIVSRQAMELGRHRPRRCITFQPTGNDRRMKKRFLIPAVRHWIHNQMQLRDRLRQQGRQVNPGLHQTNETPSAPLRHVYLPGRSEQHKARARPRAQQERSQPRNVPLNQNATTSQWVQMALRACQMFVDVWSSTTTGRFTPPRRTQVQTACNDSKA